MKVKSLGKNQTEVSFSDWRILVSYETPVAAIIPTGTGKTKVLRTSKSHSQTTTRHINQWFRDIFGYDPNIEELPQGYFDQLLER